MKVIITFTFCCDNIWKSIVFGSEKSLENSGNFSFSYFVVTLIDLVCHNLPIHALIFLSHCYVTDCCVVVIPRRLHNLSFSIKKFMYVCMCVVIGSVSVHAEELV